MSVVSLALPSLSRAGNWAEGKERSLREASQAGSETSHALLCMMHTHTHTHAYVGTHAQAPRFHRTQIPFLFLGQCLGRSQAPAQSLCSLPAYSPPWLCCSQGTGGWRCAPTFGGGPLAWDPWTVASGSTSSEGTSCAGTTTCSSGPTPDRGDRV